VGSEDIYGVYDWHTEGSSLQAEWLVRKAERADWEAESTDRGCGRLRFVRDIAV
jgi:hypothetical protein